MSYRKVGGLHFIKVWRFSMSFCICKAKPAKREWPGRVYDPFTKAECRAYQREMSYRAAHND